MSFHPRLLCLFLTASLTLADLTAAHAQAFSYGHPGTPFQVSRTIKITANDAMRFIPDTLVIQSGQTIRFIVTNKGQVDHEFVLGDKKEQLEHEQEMQQMRTMAMTSEPNGINLKPGQSKTLIWTFDKPGPVEFACHEPGHFAAGMTGNIIVKNKTPI
ncbi:MAG: cupredoxin family protein [Proteobacteria bacterium]|nr:cupredoxin family protein [Pseudomonadota bacterium]MDE3208599.1 cupredoxin family protein [Pseudomonadota bacterium]